MKRPHNVEKVHAFVRELRARHAGHRPPHVVHRRLPGRDRRGVPGTPRLREGDPLRPRGLLHLLAPAMDRRLRDGRAGPGRSEARASRPLHAPAAEDRRETGETLRRARPAPCSSRASAKTRTATRSIAGRTYREAPEVDGLVFARGAAEPGAKVRVHIDAAENYDLFGTVIS